MRRFIWHELPRELSEKFQTERHTVRCSLLGSGFAINYWDALDEALKLHERCYELSKGSSESIRQLLTSSHWRSALLLKPFS